MENIEKANAAKEKVLLRFLQQTKQGKYAKIEKSSLKYVRVKEQRELIEVPTSTFRTV